MQVRAKDATSFGRKAATPSEDNPTRPKYLWPLEEITDLAGIRIITHVLGALPEIHKIVHDEFEVIEQSDKGEELIAKERFGYQSIHYLVGMNPDRARLAEYDRYKDAVVEIQVRTILQHAWAEIQHDIQYKSTTAIPSEIKRRFMALAGMLEIADREFQDIQGTDRKITDTAREMVARGELGGVEITPVSLKQFLDQRMGADARISDWTYGWTARLVKGLGFTDLKQIQTAIADFDDNQISHVACGSRRGQVTRFQLMLLAPLGERFIDRHPWRKEAWFPRELWEYLQKLQENGIQTSTYDPTDVTDLSPMRAGNLGAPIEPAETGLPWSRVTSHEPPEAD